MNLTRLTMQVQRFWENILGGSVPDTPTALSKERHQAALVLLREELYEFEHAHTVEAQADALVDLIYVAAGRLVEMGYVPGMCFEEVHNANMRKVKGANKKRPEAALFDAVKPPDWVGPDWQKLASMPIEDLRAFIIEMRAATKAKASMLPDAEWMHEAGDAILLERGQQYNRGTIKPKDYFPFRDASYGQMIYLKALRLVSCIESLNGNTTEKAMLAIEDSLVDMYNYMRFYAEYLKPWVPKR